MMTLTQYKKVIKSLTRDELEAHLFEMFNLLKFSRISKAVVGAWNPMMN